MNVKLRVLSTGALFFLGQAAFAQTTKKDSASKVKQIDEVVVLGYSKTATKTKSTAAVTTISAETLENRPNTTFLNSIQGSAPGLSVNSSSGSPGSGKIDIIIRGVGSLNASTDPLYVIDGLTTSATQFRNLNPNDIESLSILKDAQATSIYGNRGANGVIVITTKTGKFNSGVRLSYDAMTSFSTFPKDKYNMSNGPQFLTIKQRLYDEFGQSPNPITNEAIANAPTTNWNKEFFRTGISQQHNLSLQFGGENVSVYSSLGYLENEGIIKGTDFKRFTFRNNIVGKSKDNRFNYSAMVGLGYSKRHQLDQEENSVSLNANGVQNVLFGSLTSDPTLAPYPYLNGKDMFNHIGQSSQKYASYILYDNMIGGVQNLFSETSINSNIKASYKLTDYLTLGNRVGIEFKQSDRNFARSPLGYLSNSVAASSEAQYGGVETISNTKDFTFNNVISLSYNQQFGEHNISLSAYADYLKAHYAFSSSTQNGLEPLFWSLGAGTGYIPFNPATPSLYVPSVSANKVNSGTLAYFATADYDYSGKYGLSATIRRDGSYRFAKENRWETFWSVAGRWNIDKESFMADSKFRMLKLRVSYGTAGNQNLGIASNNFNSIYLRPNNYLDLDKTYRGYGNLVGYYFVPSNPNLQWERQSQANIGLDFNYNSVIEGSVDVYRKLTNRLFNEITVSAASGGLNDDLSPEDYYIDGNNGELENKGVEIGLRGHIFKKEDLKLSVYVNAAYNKNKILSMDYANLTDDNVNAAGGPADQWYLYEYLGVNPDTGEQVFRGANGQATEAPTANDRVFTGKSIYAKWTGGAGIDAEYKGFFASAFFSFQAGGWQYDNLYAWAMNPLYTTIYNNVSSDLLNAWTPDNRNTDIPALSAVNADSNDRSDRYLYKTDFIRLKNVSIGYNFTKKQLGGLPIRSLKLYAQGENLYTWTDWRGYDPEPTNQYSLGVYPNPKTISVGVNVEF
ncbi:hypothetical protein BBI01_17240 [Chryseobacterium artocarpi]|uniref:TonB-dependent receptor plug domain-containing protein n=1 Tax=Chryseobacterium artocarpi TaxID=1414727 RepID=A0A1B8ZBH7_9FLAO|nr:SusC/RagA family TonB-linked outer membrane protein [Chryseobacterium artocarpi]OCA68961.1 hypothetical protein BBI01_17240 [Chryseobacterium artocarpi]